jgi:nucleoside-diphosphate-sugar epimerase
MHILVTGAGGFIGGWLVRRLAADHRVTAVVRPGRALPVGAADGIEADLAELNVRALPNTVDAVVHLGQSIAYRDFPGGAADMMAVNVVATGRLLEWARVAGARTFVLASTGSVHGDGAGPFREDGAVAPTTYYSATKLAAEVLCAPYVRFLRPVILRLWTPYGPGQRDRFVPNLLARVERGEAVTLDGSDGLRCVPTHVDDVTRCLEAACADVRWTGVINVATADVVSVRAVAELAGQLLGRAPLLQLSGLPSPPPLIPDLTRLRTLIDVNSFIPFAAGLRDLIALAPPAPSRERAEE